MPELPPVEPLPPRTLLTTPSRFRDAMPAADLDDDELERAIGRATARIESYCNRAFARARVVENASGRPVRTMLLSRTPVVEVHGVTRNGIALPAGNYHLALVTGLLTLVQHGRSPMTLHNAIGGALAAELVGVDYTAGYVVPDLGVEGDLPPDLEHAAMLLVRGDIDLRQRGGLGASAERLGDASRTYGGEPEPGFAAARHILDHYRRTVL